MARIVLLDDDSSLLDVLALAFEEAGHTVESARDGRTGFTIVTKSPADLIVSDVNMPGIDGFTLCRRLRDAGVTTPVILLTSRDSEIDEALGLELGADDYVAKPFSTRVLLARGNALLRRQLARGLASTTGSAGARSAVVRVGALELDGDRLEVRYRGVELVTTVTEFRMLEVLSGRSGVVFSRDRLLELVRGDDSVVAARIVDTYVRRLRRKLEAIDPDFDQIETIIGAGYRWRDRAD